VVTTEKLTQLLDDLVDRVLEAEHAVALSPDGLVLATSREVDSDLAEQLSSVVAGLQALALAASRHSAAAVGGGPGTGAVRQIIVQMQRAFFFITATPGGAVLAVRFTGEADVDGIAYEVALFAGTADRHLPTFPVPAQPGNGSDLPVSAWAGSGPFR
jgi:predicted regulator of Ras-like GTPase activity (Roadblock/LC7/MglB family)